MLSADNQQRTFSHYTATISGDELHPINELLKIAGSAVSKAEQLLASSDKDFQFLKQLDYLEDSKFEKCFFFLRWQNFGLCQFIEDARNEELGLWSETNNGFLKKRVTLAMKLQ